MSETVHYGRPRFISDWCLASVIEAVVLVLISPAFVIRGETAVVFGVLAASVLLLAAAALWWSARPLGYHLLALIYAVSVAALLGAGLAFLMAQTLIMAVFLAIMACLIAFLFAGGRRGWAYVLILVVVIATVIRIVSSPEGMGAALMPAGALLGVYLFAGGAVRFYFGHTVSSLDSHQVLGYFGFADVPRSRRILIAASTWLRHALDFAAQILDRPVRAVVSLLRRPTDEAEARETVRARLSVRVSPPALGGIVAVCLLAAPFLVSVFEQQTDLSLLITLNVGLLFVVLALGLNIVVGFSGLLDLGYAAFFAIGAYTLGVFTWPNLRMEWSFWVVIWISAAIAAVFGMIIGAPTLRLRGDYLAIVTLAFGEIVPRMIRELWDINIAFGARFIVLLVAFLVALLAMVPLRIWVALRRAKSKQQGRSFALGNLVVAVGFVAVLIGVWLGGVALIEALGIADTRWVLVENLNLTNGPQGMNPVGRPRLFGQELGVNTVQLGPLTITPPMQWSYLIMVVGALVIFATHRLERSRLGRAWMAIREDETAADAMGVDPIHTKLLAFALGASFSGFAGSIYASMLQAIFPELFSFLMSVFLLILVIVSGMGNIWGVLAGGLIIAVFDRVILAQIVPQYVPGGDVLQRWRWVMYASGLIAMMILRPEGLFPSKARQAELHEGDKPTRTPAIEEQVAEGG